PALVVEIVAVAIVGERGDDDRPETLRAPRGDLERGETAPRDPHHAGPPGSLRLLCDPFYHVLGVLLLLLQILVHESAVGIAASAQVHADARVAVARDVRVVDGVANCREVALPVGDVFHDRRYRLLGGRPPDPGGKFRTVRELDPHVALFEDLLRELSGDLHPRSCHSQFAPQRPRVPRPRRPASPIPASRRPRPSSVCEAAARISTAGWRGRSRYCR